MHVCAQQGVKSLVRVTHVSNTTAGIFTTSKNYNQECMRAEHLLVRCVIMCIECALERFMFINTTHNNNYYITPIVSNTHFHQHSRNAHNPNRISIISGAHEG